MNLTKKKRLSGVIWGVGALLAVVWSSLDYSTIEARGIGYAQPAVVASLEFGRLDGLDVVLHQNVRVGEIVARLHLDSLTEERRIAEADLLAVQQQLAADVATESRRFAEGWEDASLLEARASTALAEARARKEGLDVQLDIAEMLLDQGASSKLEVIALRQEVGVVDAQIAGWASSLARANAATNAAEERVAERERGEPWVVVAATRRLEAIEARISRAYLSSPIDGQVSWVYRKAGDPLMAGEAVLEVRQQTTDEVIAWLPESDARRVEVGDSGAVIRTDGTRLAGELESIGASPRRLPARLWTNPAMAEWGVPVRVRVADGVVAPDEQIRLIL